MDDWSLSSFASTHTFYKTMTETGVDLNFSFVHVTEINLNYSYYIQGTSVNPSGD